MSELKVNQEGMRKVAQKLSDDVEDHKVFGKKPFENELAMLKGMNTDFTERFKAVLRNINDGHRSIIEELEDITNKAIKVADEFEALDEKLTGKMKK